MRGRPAKKRKTKSRSKAAKATRGRISKSKKATKSRKTKAAAKRKTGRKASARATKKTSRKTTSRSAGRGRQRKEVFGEDNYTASREFRRDQTGFVRRNRDRLPEMGEEAAAALDGSEGNELRQAEDTARSHSFGNEG